MNLNKSLLEKANLLGTFARVLINSHIWFGGSIISCSMFSAQFLTIHWNHQITAIIFCSILFAYNYDRLIDAKLQKSTTTNSKMFYQKPWMIFSTVSMILAASSIFYLLLVIPYLSKMITFFCISMGALYSVPIIPSWKKHTFKLLRIKEIPFFKPLIVALTFTIGIVGLPLSYQPQLVNNKLISCIFLFFFTLMFTGTVTFDIRDIESDKKHEVPTLPVLIGVKNTKATLLLLNSFVTVLLTYLWFLDFITLQNLISMLFSVFSILIGVAIAGKRVTKNSDNFYDLIIISFYFPLLISLLLGNFHLL